MRILIRTSITWINAKLRMLYRICSTEIQSENSHLRERRIREKKKKKISINIDLLLIFRATICSNNDKLHGTLVHRTEWRTPPHNHQILHTFPIWTQTHNQNVSVFMQIFPFEPMTSRLIFSFSHRQHTPKMQISIADMKSSAFGWRHTNN